MSLKRFKQLLFLICLQSVFFSFGQEKQKITVKYSGSTSTSPDIKDGALVFLRDKSQQVHFIHKGADLFCDKAIYYEDQDFIEAFSNVVMKQGDSINMVAKYLEYSGKSQLAIARGNVVLQNRNPFLKPIPFILID